MKSKNYWRESLGNALPNQILTEKEIDDIMAISEMEYEYTEHQAHSPSKYETNPLEKLLKNWKMRLGFYLSILQKLKK